MVHNFFIASTSRSRAGPGSPFFLEFMPKEKFQNTIFDCVFFIFVIGSIIKKTMGTTSGIFQLAVFILTLQVIFYCHGVNAKGGNNEDTNAIGFLNPQWSELWGGIAQSHHDSGDNLKISRSKRTANGFGFFSRPKLSRNYRKRPSYRDSIFCC